jgi:ATP-dependent Clp protease ATP-binding subunit ClpC
VPPTPERHRGPTGTVGGVFERFTDRARRVLALAQEEARLLNHSFIGTEHILLGLIQEGGGLGARALTSLGISFEDVRDRVEEIVGASAASASTGLPPFTPRAKKVLELALREALQRNDRDIGTEHILLGLVREGNGVAATVLVGLGVDLGRVRQAVTDLMQGESDVELEHLDREGSAGGTRSAWRADEPVCPRCRASLAETARFRNMVISAEDEGADPISVSVVYCLVCGTTLHMLTPGEG